MSTLDTVLQLLGIKPQNQEFISPMDENQPTPTPTPDPIEQKIRQGLTNYGGEDLPALNYVPQIMQAMERYPFLKNNPYLIPELMILETSGGRNITKPNNLVNWGISYPGNNEAFSKMTKEQVLERALSGLGNRSPYYSQFRTGNPMTAEELLQFAKIYEPMNYDYGRSLSEGIKYFDNQK